MFRQKSQKRLSSRKTESVIATGRRYKHTSLVVVTKNDIIDPIGVKLGALAKGTRLARLNSIYINFPLVFIGQRLFSKLGGSLSPCSYDSAENVSRDTYRTFIFIFIYRICPASYLFLSVRLNQVKLGSSPFPTFPAVLPPLVFASSLVAEGPRREQDHLFLI